MLSVPASTNNSSNITVQEQLRLAPVQFVDEPDEAARLCVQHAACT